MFVFSKVWFAIFCTCFINLWFSIHSILLAKVSAVLKPFLPQLQRTFIKSLAEPALEVRIPARKCLTLLLSLQTRLDPLVAELTTGIKTAEDEGVKEAMWDGLHGLLKCLGSGGREINEASRKIVETLVVEALLNSSENDDSLRVSASKCFGALAKYVPRADAKIILSTSVFAKSVNADDIPWFKFHGVLRGVSSLVSEDLSLISEFGFTPNLLTYLAKGLADEKPQVSEVAVQCSGKILLANAKAAEGETLIDEEDKVKIVSSLVGVAKPENPRIDARRMAVKVIKNTAKANYKVQFQ
jgi:hypothetical protein